MHEGDSGTHVTFENRLKRHYVRSQRNFGVPVFGANAVAVDNDRSFTLDHEPGDPVESAATEPFRKRSYSDFQDVVHRLNSQRCYLQGARNPGQV